MASKDTLSRVVVTLIAAVVVLLLVVVLFASLCGCADAVSVWFETVSGLIAVLDDLVVRLVALALLVLAASGIIVSEFQAYSGNQTASGSSRGFALLKLAALMGLSGASFFAAYPLDQLDDEEFKRLNALKSQQAVVADRPAAILADWVQVVPANGSPCRLPSNGNGGAIPDEDSAIADCPYDLVVRAVVKRNSACPAAKLASSAQTAISLQLREREAAPVWGYEEIKVCQAPLPRASGLRSVAFRGSHVISIPASWSGHGGPGQVVLLGDTGCRADDRQICDERNWPLAPLANEIAKPGGTDAAQAELIIHLGDYMYVKFDTWESWKASFFAPAKPLLAVAPWIMVRGNHERCGKHGDAPHGFDLFFGTGEVAPCDGNVERLGDTYALDLSSKHRVIVADSATAYADDVEATWDGRVADEDKAVLGDMKAVLGQVKRLAQGKAGKSVWLATHVPVFALECEEVRRAGGKTGCAVASTGQFAADTPKSSALLRVAWLQSDMSGVTRIFSGDRHLFQLIKADPNSPLQVTVGTGGVNLDPAPLTGEGDQSCHSEANLGAIASGAVPKFAADWQYCSNESHGFARARRSEGKFKVEFVPLEPPTG